MGRRLGLPTGAIAAGHVARRPVPGADRRAAALDRQGAGGLGAAHRGREGRAEVLYGSRVLRRARRRSADLPRSTSRTANRKGIATGCGSRARNRSSSRRKLASEADWMAAGREVFDGLHLAEFRTADPCAFRWADDPDLMAREGVTVAADGTNPGVRWLINHDQQLKITLADARRATRGCARRQHRPRRATQPPMGVPAWFQLRCARRNSPARGRTRQPSGMGPSRLRRPWLKDDIDATLKAMTADRVGRVDGEAFLGTFVGFNASPWFTTREVLQPDRRQRPAVVSTRPRAIAIAGPEDIARYGAPGEPSREDGGEIGTSHVSPGGKPARCGIAT